MQKSFFIYLKSTLNTKIQNFRIKSGTLKIRDLVNYPKFDIIFLPIYY